MNVTDINECASSPCADGETCVDGVDGYECDMGHHACGSGTVDYHFKGPVVCVVCVCGRSKTGA